MSEPNNDKLTFGRTIETMTGDTPTSSGCHNYGIISGCDENCPVLLDGKCPEPEETKGYLD